MMRVMAWPRPSTLRMSPSSSSSHHGDLHAQCPRFSLVTSYVTLLSQVNGKIFHPHLESFWNWTVMLNLKTVGLLLVQGTQGFLFFLRFHFKTLSGACLRTGSNWKMSLFSASCQRLFPNPFPLLESSLWCLRDCVHSWMKLTRNHSHLRTLGFFIPNSSFFPKVINPVYCRVLIELMAFHRMRYSWSDRRGVIGASLCPSLRELAFEKLYGT